MKFLVEVNWMLVNHRLLLTVMFLIGCCAWSANASDWYVNNQLGDDRNSGTSPGGDIAAGGPLRTIKRALNLANRGDRIIIENTGVPYYESITLQGARHSGSAQRPFIIQSNGAVLDGRQEIPSDQWHHVEGYVFRFEPRLKSHQKLFLDNHPLPRVSAGGSAPPRLEPLQWSLHRGSIYFHTEPPRMPWDYNLSKAGEQTGITLYQVENVVIADLVVQGFQLDGINAHDLARNVEIVGCTLRGNGRSGASVGGASVVRIHACLIGDNAVAQVRTEGFSHLEIENSDLVEADSIPLIQRTGGRITVDSEEFSDE